MHWLINTHLLKKAKESIYIWLIITKMGSIEGWDTFTGHPKLLTDEIEKRIQRLFPNL